jgi:hypothetical protein
MRQVRFDSAAAHLPLFPSRRILFSVWIIWIPSIVFT